MDNIKLWNSTSFYYEADFGQEEPSLTPYICKNSKYCMVIFPGGAYAMRASHEGHDVAKRFNDYGISAFVVNYRVAPYDHRAMIADGQRAVKLAKYLGKTYGYSQSSVGVVGFSAGGHLCSVVSTHFSDADQSSDDPVEHFDSRPCVSGLCYAVLSLIENAHVRTRDNFIGKDITDPDLVNEMLLKYSAEKAVSDKTVPTFLWHTAQDTGVSVFHSLNMAKALVENKIPCELHIYPYGSHGKGLCTGDFEIPLAHTWFEQFVSFYKHEVDKLNISI